jgi:hypothetical protein
MEVEDMGAILTAGRGVGIWKADKQEYSLRVIILAFLGLVPRIERSGP